MRRAAAKEVTVAVHGHPSRAGQMSFPGASRPIRFSRGIDVQHHFNNVLPIGAVAFGVEQTEVGDQMLLVIAGQDRRARRFIGDIRVKRWLPHG